MSTVVKAFQILEAIVAHQERGLAYSEVVAETQLPKATAHRVLKSLAGMGYLRFDVGGRAVLRRPEAGRPRLGGHLAL